MSKYLTILSKDVRSNKIKTWYGIHDKSKEQITLYRKGRSMDKSTGLPKMYFDRFIPDSILDTGIFKMGTSTYYLQY